jgi:acyl-CoA reductase-like NAD-dependent aldehyde dehydrogenase
MAQTVTEGRTPSPAAGEGTSATEMAEVVGRARAAGQRWAKVPPAQRARHLLRARLALLERMDEVVDTMVAETGKLRTEAIVNEILVACELITWYARNAPKVLAPRKVAPGILVHKRAERRLEPLGVVAVISPWNYPLVLSLGPVSTALFAGNAVVLKPSEFTPGTGRLVGQLFSGLGAHGDIVQVVTGDGRTGDTLVRSEVDKVCFTGSVATGTAVMRAAAERRTPVLLELGGKDPMIVCADADLDRAAAAAVWGAFTNCGQTCIGTERVYVVDEVYDAFVQKVLDLSARLRQAPDGDVGAMIHSAQVEVSEAHVADAVSKGATVATGGRRTVVGGRPAFEPTVLLDVDHTMLSMRDETFGPLLPVMRVSGPEEALALANDTPYGLGASVFARDRELVERLVDGLEAGNVWVNDVMVGFAVPGLPFGGVKASGTGVTHGEDGLREFTRVKAVVRDVGGLRREPMWLPLPRHIGSWTRWAMRLKYRGRRR